MLYIIIQEGFSPRILTGTKEADMAAKTIRAVVLAAITATVAIVAIVKGGSPM